MEAVSYTLWDCVCSAWAVWKFTVPETEGLVGLEAWMMAIWSTCMYCRSLNWGFCQIVVSGIGHNHSTSTHQSLGIKACSNTCTFMLFLSLCVGRHLSCFKLGPAVSSVCLCHVPHLLQKWQRKYFRLDARGDLYYYDNEKVRTVHITLTHVSPYPYRRTHSSFS